jgi:hypothetical protein
MCKTAVTGHGDATSAGKVTSAICPSGQSGALFHRPTTRTLSLLHPHEPISPPWVTEGDEYAVVRSSDRVSSMPTTNSTQVCLQNRKSDDNRPDPQALLAALRHKRR